MALQNTRPVFLNLLQIRLSWMAIVSIAHRISGLLLLFFIPVMLTLLGLSLSGAQGFTQTMAIVQGLPFKLLALLVLWAFLHHLLAGIRFLLIDLDIGVYLQQAKVSAVTVLISSISLAILVGLLL